MRWMVVFAACAVLAACGDAGPPRVVRAPQSALRFVKPPLVVVNEGGGVTVWVRLNRSLRDNEGYLTEHPDFGAYLEIPGTRPDIPSLYRDDLHPACYGQSLDGDLATDKQVDVALVLGEHERIVATVVPEAREAGNVDGRPWQRLGCRSDRGATRRCEGSVAAEHLGDIGIQSATNASCATARAVMRRVGRWADSGRCYETLCVSGHRLNRGYRCSVDLVGEAAWQITCVRGERIVRGYTAD